jgi:hypothetical protein
LNEVYKKAEGIKNFLLPAVVFHSIVCCVTHLYVQYNIEQRFIAKAQCIMTPQAPGIKTSHIKMKAAAINE